MKNFDFIALLECKSESKSFANLRFLLFQLRQLAFETEFPIQNPQGAPDRFILTSYLRVVNTT